MQRVLLAVIWLAAAGGVGVAVFSIYELKRDPVRAVEPISIELMPTRQRVNTLARWTLTERFSAHNIVVAHVETEHLDEALGIARQLVDPLKGDYAEVLIYFHRPGRPDTLPPRRVQWTPTSGYVETVYE